MNPDPSGSGQPTLVILVLPSVAGVTVALQGELDMVTASWLRQELDQVFAEPGRKRLILDLSGLTFCDSSGLGAMIGAYNQVQQTGGQIALVGAQERLRSLLVRTGLDRILPHYPTLAEAESAFTPPPPTPDI
ncbi:STAS domain-containing protein [Nonomuraea dietziae]|uniref:Anti-sigma factor antagonist n=1 Tax=Nonomuraea dietziae TaxID=65515 RepID=A0A7W5VGA0_9ACTN|nr:STAS domain-containing protein [Nonomuraea dietziae]MBB3733130.1 anti-sigma B factor antagonist [Nonomuraea dietziae]